jgi:hypothetical protein
MREAVSTALALLALAAGVRADLLDDLDRRLAVRHGWLRLDVSGEAILAGWLGDGHPTGLIFGDDDDVASPRLTLLLDAHLGRRVYGFVRTSVDRGFDPLEEPDGDVRADEYALRWTPFEAPWLHVQAGKFATVIGGWVPRHTVWENAFVSAPLPYEYVTVVGDASAAPTVETLVARRDQVDEKRLWVPMVWGPVYASGVAAFGRVDWIDYAVEVKNAAPSSRPEVWALTSRPFSEPTVGGRVGVRPGPAWNLGISGAVGPYLRKRATATLGGRDPGDFLQSLVGADASFAVRRLELWAEILASRFDVPIACRRCAGEPARVDVDTLAYYLEGRYEVAAGWFVALRAGQQLFGRVREADGERHDVDRDAWRSDVAAVYRPTRQLQVKVQYGYVDQTGEQTQGPQVVAMQLGLRF